ncbi:MAG: PQQ-dependent sugar dehydrogenase [Anaerolineaceae bacterium]|nr:PQQ-dependent sugar dehydrogenase [Anaerolineaceae bacterium]
MKKLTLVLLLIALTGAVWFTTAKEADAAPTGQAAGEKALITYFPFFRTSPDYIYTQAALDLIAGGLASPVDLAVPDDGTDRLFIVDQAGKIYIVDNTDTLLTTPFLDISDRLVTLNPNGDERGLLGMAFHPDYAANGRFFVYYSAPLRAGGTGAHTNQVTEFQVDPGNPNLADPTSEKIIIQIDHPQSNHNAGPILFGPDGFLYIAQGDGGGGGDDDAGHVSDWYAVNGGGNGQDVEANMLGSILRIDVDHGDPYAIPSDNPDISTNFPETWAYGFRNPYRMAFDPGGTHELFVADVGQNLWEEASIVEAGGNYGWNVREGTHCFSTADPENPTAITTCPTQTPEGDPLIDPVIEFPNHDNPDGGFGTAIIGGVIYRGGDVPTWEGNYFFGNWSRNYQPDGDVFIGIRPAVETGETWAYQAIEFTNTPNGRLNQYLLAFGQDLQGQIYILTSGQTGPSGTSGQVFRLVP